MSKHVSIVKTEPIYPSEPFSPSKHYPEYRFGGVCGAPNHVYDAVRQSFFLLGLDRERFDTPEWNPLRGIVEPGQRVLIKPNFVSSVHWAGGELQAVITHGSVIRAVVDYVIRSLEGEGQIVIADSPERTADFAEIISVTGLEVILDFYQAMRDVLGDVEILVRDMRRQYVEYGYGAIARCQELAGDPNGYTLVTLQREDSAFAGLSQQQLRRLYGADYNRRETLRAHTKEYHQYDIANTVLGSDVVISLPKLKTHYRVGTTLNCKGFIGTAGNKNLLPHRILGDPSNGGDTYERPAASARARFYRWLDDFLKDELLGRAENVYTALAYSLILRGARGFLRPPREEIHYHGGCWYGNDTTWRSVVDMTRIVHYADEAGRIMPTIQRQMFSVVDGIVGGDVDGPMKLRSRRAGVVLSGQDMVAVDVVATSLMGFDPLKLKYIAALLEPHPSMDLSFEYPADLITCSSVPKYARLMELRRDDTLAFEVPTTWRDSHIELQ